MKTRWMKIIQVIKNVGHVLAVKSEKYLTTYYMGDGKTCKPVTRDMVFMRGLL